ncbi:hypothetical protein D3C73_883650 [compost metagenome]
MPFSGQYILGGKLSHLNEYKSSPNLEELTNLFVPMLSDIDYSKLVLLNSGEWFDIDSSSSSAPFILPSPSERISYIDNVLHKRKMLYEDKYEVKESEWKDLTDRLTEAYQRMLRYQKKIGYNSNWKVYIDSGQGYLYCVPFDETLITKINHGQEESPFLRIRIDYSLLMMILERKAHWNNADNSSHLRYYRSPDIYEMPIYLLLSYFHC